MNKLCIATTALFLASTAAAHAGNSISFEIEGQHIRIETARNCAGGRSGGHHARAGCEHTDRRVGR